MIPIDQISTPGPKYFSPRKISGQAKDINNIPDLFWSYRNANFHKMSQISFRAPLYLTNQNPIFLYSNFRQEEDFLVLNLGE
jgi:hypothetical protein